MAAEKELPQQTLFKNVNIFNGTDDKLYETHNVLIEENTIKAISAKAITVNAEATIIDGGGRTLIPGLVESHAHLNLQYMVGGYETIENRDWQEIGAMAAFAANRLLLDGYGTVRDLGTLQSGLWRPIDDGNAIVSCIYSADGAIGQTTGHGDGRMKGSRTLESRDTYKAAQLSVCKWPVLLSY